jgi:NAD(P)-dependent dehydrogenase (short-subunit alcohol dehydrogenase family)
MNLKEYDLSGRIAIVTGAGKGIGEHIAVALAESGANISLVGRNLKNLVKVGSRLRAIGRNALIIKADVRRESEIARLVKRTLAKFGRIDILVNNAGIIQRLPTINVLLKEWEEIMGTNLTGPFLCMKACQPIMAKQGKGSIINLGSVAGIFGRENMAAYCASKGGVINLTRALAIEWAKYGIRVNAIAPGQCKTEMGAPLFRDKIAFRDFLRKIPLRRIAMPREVGVLAAFLASDASDYMTGEVIVLDGGLSAF